MRTKKLGTPQLPQYLETEGRREQRNELSLLITDLSGRHLIGPDRPYEFLLRAPIWNVVAIISETTPKDLIFPLFDLSTCGSH